MSCYVTESLTYNINSINDLVRTKKFIENNIEEYISSISKLEKELLYLKEDKTLYGLSVEDLYQEGIGALKDTLDTALKYVFFDRNLEVDLVLEDKRGNKTLSILLNDLDKDVFGMEPKDDEGLGVCTILGAILKLYLLLNKNSNILLLDEKYSAVSISYLPRFFEFLKSFCKEKAFTIIIITHDPRIASYADSSFLVEEGVVSVIEISGEGYFNEED